MSIGRLLRRPQPTPRLREPRVCRRGGRPNESDEQNSDPLAPYQSLWLGILGHEENLLNQLAAWGFSPEAEALTLLKSLRQSPKILAMHAQSRERLDVFIPKLLRALKQAQQPQQALTRLLPFWKPWPAAVLIYYC